MQTVLVVDDNETLAYFTARNLQRRVGDCEVLIATSCDQARKSMDQRIVALAIVDAKLPDGDGLELLKEIRADNENVVSILISGEPSRANNLPEWAHFMAKPYEVETLIELAQKSFSRVTQADNGPHPIEVPLSEKEAQSISANRHEALNRLASLLIGLKAFAADLRANSDNSSEINRLTDEYVEKLCEIIRDVSTIINEGKKK
jgi:two-component system response regulator YesN